eukprot:COSAG02_NODE_4443_length_5352_cov_1.839520_2_plen_83_part_00
MPLQRTLNVAFVSIFSLASTLLPLMLALIPTDMAAGGAAYDDASAPCSLSAAEVAGIQGLLGVARNGSCSLANITLGEVMGL